MENNELQTSERLSARAQIMNTLAPAAQGLKHTSLYSAVGMGLMLATGSAANATIISGSSASLIVGNGDTGGVGWDIDGDTIDDIVFTDSTTDTSTFCLFSAGAGAGFASTGGEELLPISGTDTVGAASAFRHLDCADLSDATCVHEHWDAFTLFNGGASFNAHTDVDGVLGFVFDNGGTANYGLAQFEIRDFDAASGNTGTFQITNWVYDDSGADILGSAIDAQPVPEPSVLALTLLGSLAMGASGLRQRRRRLANQSQH